MLQLTGVFFIFFFIIGVKTISFFLAFIKRSRIVATIMAARVAQIKSAIRNPREFYERFVAC